MLWIAWRMLTGDPAKYLGIVVGIAFSSLLISQQSSIFCGLMSLTFSQIRDIQGASIWVMDPNTQFVDDIKPMSSNLLYRVRGVPGVAWAVNLYKGIGRARLPSGDYEQVILLGLDDATLIGAPREVVFGSLDALRQPDAVIIDERGYHRLWPNEPYMLGKTLELFDRRAVIVGVCKASQTFQTFPVLYTRYSQALLFNPPERKMLTFVLAEPEPNIPIHTVTARITTQTGHKALTSDEFSWMTIWYFLRETGIPINFAITVLLGFMVGAAVCGQTFYLFTIENLKQFAMLKALGAYNWQIVAMILFQALIVGVFGYGLGVGAAAIFGIVVKEAQRIAFLMPWQVLALTGALVLLMILISALISIRRVLILQPARVFQD